MIVEFAGLPRSGKSTCIDAVENYFSRRGIMVRIAREAARARPFRAEERRLEAACWTANYALNTVLAASLGTDSQTLTLQDRGLFDSLAFFRLLKKQRPSLRERLSSFEGYFADPTWAKDVDLVILLDVEPEVAIQRDIASHVAEQLHGKDKGFKGLPGLITNKSVLQTLRTCYNEIRVDFRDRFNIKKLDTSQVTMVDMVKQVVEHIVKEYERQAVKTS